MGTLHESGTLADKSHTSIGINCASAGLCISIVPSSMPKFGGHTAGLALHNMRPMKCILLECFRASVGLNHNVYHTCVQTRRTQCK
jgi:hypothetical protein